MLQNVATRQLRAGTAYKLRFHPRKLQMAKPNPHQTKPNQHSKPNRKLACRRSRLRSMRASQGARPGPSPPHSACTIICTLNDTCATAAAARQGREETCQLACGTQGQPQHLVCTPFAAKPRHLTDP